MPAPEEPGFQAGLLYVVATLLPLASFLILLLVGGLRNFLRKHREGGGLALSLHNLLGGDTPGRTPAYFATAAIGLGFVCSLVGFVELQKDLHHVDHLKLELKQAKHKHRNLATEVELAGKKHEEQIQKLDDEIHELEEKLAKAEVLPRFTGSAAWASVRPNIDYDKSILDPAKRLPPPATVLSVGYRIDNLAALMFLMVTLIATLIHVFSIGYMSEELERTVTDHQVHTEGGHLHRRGRFGRFFMYLSLFCFSMLNLVLADNFFQIFVSWELVGICSFLLIGHYYERISASNAANKAFITNRIGDAGFIIGMLILFTYIGSFNFQDIFAQLRAPHGDSHGDPLDFAGQIVRADIPEDKAGDKVSDARLLRRDEPTTASTVALLFPRRGGHFHHDTTEFRTRENPNPSQFGRMPYWLLVVAGLGIFLGCVGKSAQFPLHVWLPDAMEGPTPVSALIHAATMVAAGVYLVGRAYPMFTPEVQLVIAYTGAITLFVAATIALVMTDIKKVLAYSTVSQLGYMMLALGIGGWIAGLFHLITHAFFKALLFLCSGSVIYNCHHEQEMTKMGGLYPKMKITALTMLVGVLAIAGTPLFSGWYSKDAILAESFGFALVPSQNKHFLLFLLPLLTAGITTFYMFRMWYMTFTGKPRDQHVYEHAHEAPKTMTVPLMILAFFSVTVAWGWPMWQTEASWLEHQIHHAQPEAIMAEFGVVADTGEEFVGQPRNVEQRHLAHDNHHLAGNLALGIVLAAFAFATLVYYRGALDPAEAKEQFPGVYRFLVNKWYFDELYSAILVRPALIVSGWCRAFDMHVIDGFVHLAARVALIVTWFSGLFDRNIIDGAANLIADVSYAIGERLRNLQTGYLRSYVLFLVLAAVGIWILLTFFFGSLTAVGGGQ